MAHARNREGYAIVSAGTNNLLVAIAGQGLALGKLFVIAFVKDG